MRRDDGRVEGGDRDDPVSRGGVALVMPMDYSALLWAGLLGWSLFQQLPSPWTWAGAPIVIAAGLVILWREQRLRITRNAVAAVADVNE